MKRPEVRPQLQALVEEFGAAQDRLQRIAARAPDAWWSRRADPARWSVAECVAHLNLTSLAYLPRIHEALKAGNAIPRVTGIRYRRDPVGWLLWKLAGPPVRYRVKTTAPFLPRATAGSEE